jgi:hypothetical protein
MKDLLKNKWLMLLIGAVVLYFVWKKFGKGESMVGAGGRASGKPCYCNGRWLGFYPQTDTSGNVVTCEQACDTKMREDR